MAVEANVHDTNGVATVVVAMVVVIADGDNSGSVVDVEKVEEVVNIAPVDSGAVSEPPPPKAGEKVGSVGVGPVIVVPGSIFSGDLASGPPDNASGESARRGTLSMVDTGIAIAQML